MTAAIRRRLLFASLLLACCLPALPAASSAAEGWGGFQNGGQVAVEGELPVKWSPEAGLAWKTELAGYGQSSPVVWGGVVYVTSTSGDMKQRLHVQALDAKGGRQRWRVDADNSTPEKSSNYVSRAAPSPVCDERGVIALFEGGNLLAIDEQGEVRWRRDLTADYGPITARHGLGSSLEQDESRVYVSIPREKQPYVLAVSKQSGETLWKAAGVETTSWSSPRLVAVAGGRHLVIGGIGKLAGLDPGSGQRLWDFDEIAGNSTPTPFPLGEGRFLIGAGVGRGEGEGDGERAAASNGVIRIRRGDDGWQASWLWRARRATSSFGSPVAYQGNAYFVNRAGVVYCLDAETGTRRYAERSPSGSIWATPIASGERLYLFGRRGTTAVIRSGDEFRVLAENSMWADAPPAAGAFGGPVLYAAAAAGDTLLIRRGTILYAVR